MEVKQVEIVNGEYQCDIGITVDEWKDVLLDNNLKKYQEVLIKFYSEPDHKSTCKALGDKYGVSPQSFNGSLIHFTKAVQKRLKRFEIKGVDGDATYWIIAMTGKSLPDGLFEWKLRPELVAAMEELNIKDKHLLQKIYDGAIGNKHWVFTSWFPLYKKNVTKFIEQSISDNWSPDVFQLLVKDTTGNGVSDLQQGNFTWEEFNKIKERWTEIQPVIRNIAVNSNISKQDYDTIINFFSKYSKQNRPAGSNRVIAAFLPNVVTTVVSYGYLREVLDQLKKILPDYPKLEGNWLNDNLNFIRYCNSNVEFSDPWHSSLFAWYLKEHFDDEKKSRKKNNAIMQHYIDLLLTNKNLILTGAPGTGKTFLAKEIALAMNAEMDFVQFHPSYDYTDFVEGLRPTRQDENGKIGFERKDGAFKEFCKRALNVDVAISVDNFDNAWENLIELIRSNLANSSLTKIGSWDYGLSTIDTLKYSSPNSPSQYTFTITKQNVHDAYQGKLARPSGAFQKDMLDVVEYMKQHVNLKAFQTEALSQEVGNKKFVFIIDEINRAEISKVFGELFFSLDAGYRGIAGRVKTQYSNLQDDGDLFKDGFYVPENVYVIGTMNDIDRSVETFDFAMRRRFAWREIKAADRTSMWDGQIDKWKDESSKRMESLNKKIGAIPGLGTAFHIGPAYFLKLTNYNGNFEQLWDNHLESILFEYLRGMPQNEYLLIELKTAFDNTVELP